MIQPNGINNYKSMPGFGIDDETCELFKKLTDSISNGVLWDLFRDTEVMIDARKDPDGDPILHITFEGYDDCWINVPIGVDLLSEIKDVTSVSFAGLKH